MTSTLKAAIAAVVVAAALTAIVAAQGRRPASPAGSSAVEVGGKYDPKAAEPTYVGGKWIEISYGRPIKRGRTLFGGTGSDYGKVVNPDAPVWRAGANESTQLKNDVPLVVNGKTIAPGTYTMFVDLKPNAWTLIVSTWPAQKRFNPDDKTAVFGAYGYTPDKDLVRAPMKLETLPHSFEQMSWQFLDMTDSGGTLAVIWDKYMGSVPFKIGS
jgi:Protein of unknown function (DUF2911)